MTIPKKLLNKWTKLHSRGDAQKIKDKGMVDVSDETINRALREGKCSEEVFSALAEFYSEREETIKEYMQ